MSISGMGYPDQVANNHLTAYMHPNCGYSVVLPEQEDDVYSSYETDG